MPLKLSVKVGTDSLEAEGDFTIDEQVVNLTKEWVKALPPQSEQDVQAQVDAAAAQLKAQNDNLQAAVTAAESGSAEGNGPRLVHPGV